MQDIEFTIQEGHLFMLQTRTGKRAGTAAVKIAVDMVDEGLANSDKVTSLLKFSKLCINNAAANVHTITQAITMVKPEHLNQLLHPQFKDTESAKYRDSLIATGLPASPGAAVGNVFIHSKKLLL